jgi:molecular chaperone GrpE (heat shock protein)
VADAIAAAQDDAERQAILETDYHDPAFDRLVRVKSEVKRERKRQERKKREEESREVAQYLKAVQVFTDAIHEAVAVAEYGKFSPEASRFVKGWHDSVRGLLAKLEQAMEDHNAKVQEQGG